MKVRELLEALAGADPSADVEVVIEQPFACCPGEDGELHEHDVSVDAEDLVVQAVQALRVVLAVQVGPTRAEQRAAIAARPWVCDHEASCCEACCMVASVGHFHGAT